ncbi:hypothetical protein [Natrialba sp. INN-245]|uniref:hypothetical protein n=1 Tax=Natrialba sp. INN-245 TaxID=2690967 RepID=UPI0013135C05|nr:hypothetical protein [Natrialba sp. INN-245]MWV38779.1 hypothetical protein [Natrialba sp. INN-245]
MKTRLFREPDEVWTGTSYVAISLPFFGLYVYGSIVRGFGSDINLLFGLLWVLYAVPELLPERHQRLAGSPRIAGFASVLLLVLYFLLQLSVFH